MDLKYLQELLYKCYTKELCFPKVSQNWSEDNKCYGMCAITALILNDYFLIYLYIFLIFWVKMCHSATRPANIVNTPFLDRHFCHKQCHKQCHIIIDLHNLQYLFRLRPMEVSLQRIQHLHR